MELTFGRSKAGHDAGKLYIIIGKKENRLLLSDGKIKLLDNPKRKNPVHVQPIVHLPGAVKEMSDGLTQLTDADIRRLIRLYEEN